MSIVCVNSIENKFKVA